MNTNLSPDTKISTTISNESQHIHLPVQVPIDERPLHGNQGNREISHLPFAPQGMTIVLHAEVGCRAETIARGIGKKLGWEVINTDHLEYLCANEVEHKLLPENLSGPAQKWAQTWIANNHFRIDKNNPKAFILTEVVFHLAGLGNLIILNSSAGSYLPAETTVHVQIIAPIEERIRYLTQEFRLSQSSAEKWIEHSEELQQDLLFSQFHQQKSIAPTVDLVLNSGRLHEDICIEMVISVLKSKYDLLISSK